MSTSSGPRRISPLAAAVLLGVAGVAGAVTVYRVGAAQRSADRAAVRAYEQAIVDAARRAGAVVQLEMKPLIARLQKRAARGDGVANRVDAWRRIFLDAKSDMLAPTPPAALRGIDVLWRRSFDAYLEAIRLFGEAARTTGADRASALRSGIRRAEEADRIYDRASALLQDARNRLGMAPSENFPKPAAGG